MKHSMNKYQIMMGTTLAMLLGENGVAESNRKFMGNRATLNEYYSYGLNLPRQCGKTTFIADTLDFNLRIPSMYANTYVITHNGTLTDYIIDKMHDNGVKLSKTYLKENHVFSANQMQFPNGKLRGFPWWKHSNDGMIIVLLDEVSISRFKNFLFETVEESEIHRFRIFSVGTDAK